MGKIYNKMIQKGILICLIGIFIFSFAVAEEFGYNYLEGDLDVKSSINYSTVNVNNSDYLDSYDSSEFWLNDGTSTATGDWDIGSYDLATTGTGTFGTQVTTPIMETSGTGDTLAIQPDATGAGDGVELFENVATGDRPKLTFWGYKDSGTPGTVKGSIYIDTWGRLTFEGADGTGSFGGILFEDQLTLDDALRFSGTTTGFLYRNIASGYGSYVMTFGGTSDVADEPIWILTTYDRKDLDFSVPDSDSVPQLWIHDGSATAGNVMKLYHDGTDGTIHSNAGDLKITADGGDINFDDDDLTTTGTGTFGRVVLGDQDPIEFGSNGGYIQSEDGGGYLVIEPGSNKVYIAGDLYVEGEMDASSYATINLNGNNLESVDEIHSYSGDITIKNPIDMDGNNLYSSGGGDLGTSSDYWDKSYITSSDPDILVLAPITAQRAADLLAYIPEENKGATLYFEKDNGLRAVIGDDIYEVQMKKVGTLPSTSRKPTKETKYKFDIYSGEVTEVQDVNREGKWEIKEGIKFDIDTGKFMQDGIEISKDDAIEIKITEVEI